MNTTEPTKNDIASYRTGASRRELLDEVHEYLNEIPQGDYDVAKRALDVIRSAAMNSDLRYAAGRFYVLQPATNVWLLDDEHDLLTGSLLQRWCDAECNVLDSMDRSLRAAWAANEAAGGDQAWNDAYATTRDRFKNAKKYWRSRVQARQSRERIVKDLRELPGVSVPQGPDAFDADPDVLAVANGLVDLGAGTVRPLRPLDLVTQQLGVEYRPDAEAPQWQRFLRQVLITDGPSPEPDEELIAWVQKLIGYSITGHASEQMFAVLFGHGANGKGVFLETLGELFDSISRTANMASFEAKAGSSGGGSASGDIARLAGARMVFTSEGEVGARLSASLIKRITGEDTITARHLFRPEFQFKPRFTLFMASNTRPHVLDASEGYWRRVRLIPFRRFFSAAERDPRLKEKLRAELPGILRWAVEGAQRWYLEGLGTTAVVDQETDAYRASTDRLAEFMSEYLEVTEQHLDVVDTQAVWMAYNAWATDNNDDTALKRSVFVSAISERRGIRADRRSGKAVLRGVKLLEVAQRKQREVQREKDSRLAELPEGARGA